MSELRTYLAISHARDLLHSGMATTILAACHAAGEMYGIDPERLVPMVAVAEAECSRKRQEAGR